MQPAHVAYHRFPGPQMEMIGIAQDDLGTGSPDVRGAEPPDDTVSADRHERGGLDLAMRQGQRPGAGGADRSLEGEVEHEGSYQLSAISYQIKHTIANSVCVADS
jgi:hypothetical protein